MLPGCSKCTDTSTCTTCLSAFWLNPNTKMCDTCSPGKSQFSHLWHLGCAACNGATQSCTSCGPGYYLKVGATQCVPLPLGCVTAIPSSGKCATCTDKYYLGDDSTCKKKPENCQQFDTQNKICTDCVQGYEFNSSMNKCIKLANSCQIFDQNEQKCTKCIEGWGLDENNVCFACPANSLGCDLHIIECEPKRYFDSVKYNCNTCESSCEVC